MPLFSSVLGLPVDEPSRQQAAAQDSNALAERDIASRLNFAGGANTEKETPSLLGPTIVGLALGGTGVAAMYYMRTPGAALRVAKRIAKTFNLDPSDMSAGGRLYGSPLKGAVEDLVYLAHHAANDKNLKPEVVNNIVEELGRATKQELANGEKQATIGDLLRQYRNSKDEREQQALKLIDESLDTLRAIPGANKQLLEENLSLGHNVLFEEGKILDYRRYTPEGLVARGLEWAHDNLRVPFIDFAPTDLLMHHGWANTRQIARLGKGEVIDGKTFAENTFAVGNKIFTKDGTVHEADFRLIGTNSSLARSLDALKGKRRNKSIHALLTEGDLNPAQRKYLEMLDSLKWQQEIEHDVLDWRTGEVAIKKGSSGDLLKAQIADQLNAAVRALETRDITSSELVSITKQYEDIIQGIGSQFEDALLSPVHSDKKAALHEAYEWVQRVYGGKVQPTTVGTGDVARDLSNDPLSIIEKVRMSLKGDVRGFNYADEGGKVIGDGVKGPKNTAGFEPWVRGVHGPNKIVEVFNDVATNPRIPTEFTVAKKGKGIVESLFTGETASAVWHSMFQRPSAILESLTGFGIRPAKTVMGAAVSNSIGAYAIAQGITQGIGYLNFIGQGVPAQAAAVAGGAVQVGMQGVYQASGIGAVSENLEEVLPGSVNSFASQIGRVVAAPFIGAALGSSMLPSQIDIGKVQFWKMLGGGTAESMVSGRALGAVTATALALSTVFIDPMKGVEQQYAEAIGEKRVAVRNARWWVAGRTPFEGDHIKFFDQSWVQKAWNYDSAMKTTYGSEGSAWANSWFPTPSNLFGVMPLIDPYFAERRNFAYRPYPEISSVGGDIPLFGSAIQATIGQILKPSVKFDVQQPEDFGKYGQFSPSEGEALGFTTQVPELDPRSSSSVGSYANKTINQLQDLTGVYGFGSRLITENLLGDATGFGGVMEMEGSDQMFSTGRQLEGLNLGGFMGHTEYIRRIFNTRPGNTNYYNPMMNQMPEWLPGSNSSYQEDRQNRNDFHMGDPYTAVELGEVRLPGPGYKAAYGYHGGEAPDIFDKWAILTDLAPGSDAQSAMGAQVVQAIESGNADEEAQAMYNRVMAEQNERRSGKYRFVDYTENVVQDPGPMGQLTKEYLGFANVNIAQSPENPALAPVRQVWDELTHTQIPGLAWAQGKFVHNRTPLEEYTANYVHGSPFADWTNPLEGFTKPGLQEIRGSVQGSDYIPYDTQKRWEIEEYYDKLKYLKARRLETRARELGRDDLAGQYRQQQQQTIVGMDYSPGSVNKNIFKALDPSYRSFAVGFAKASPEEAERILPYLPNYQKDMWQNIWAGNKVMPGEVNTEDARMRADEEVAAYFSQRALPEVDEAVWNPDVSLDEYKVKTAESEGVSYFTMGIPEAKAVEFRSIGRADVVLDTSPFMDNVSRRNALLTEFHSSGNYQPSVSMSNIRQTQKFRYNKGRQDRESVNAYQGRF